MFVENAFPSDTRVKNESDALAAAGFEVTVVALRKRGQPRSELLDGVQVYRLPRLELFEKTPCENPTLLQRIGLKIKSVLGYVSEYAYFTSACMAMSLYVAVKKGFDAIHAHNPPDTLFLVALPWKLLGKKYVFDHHDLCPELYQSRYGTGRDLVARVLQALEWCNLKLANATIATNQSYKQIQIDRGGRKPDSIFIVRNGPNRKRMAAPEPSPRLKSKGKKILCYIGSLNPQDGVDYLLRSLGHLLHDLHRTDFYCVVMGSGDSLEDLKSLARELKITDHIELTGFISDAELAANLSAADICVDPDPSSPLNDVSTWIKIMEYMAYSKPIVSFDLKETRYSAQDACLYVPPNDERQFASAVATLMDDPERCLRMGNLGRQRVERELQWSVVSKNLVKTYQSLGFAPAAREMGAAGSPAPSPLVSVVIVSWNTREYLDQCLTSLTSEACRHPMEIIVVDNASTDGSPEWVERRFPQASLLRNESNLGFAKANNQGIARSKGDYVCLINSDVKVLKGCITQLVDYCQTHPEAGLVGPRIIGRDGRLQRSCRGFPGLWNMTCRAFALDTFFPWSKPFCGYALSHWRHEAKAEVDILSGCFWVARREALEDVGLLDERFFIYGEDMDWCRRFWSRGWKLVFYPSAEAIHYGGVSSANAPVRFHFEQQKADLQFWNKHHSWLACRCYFLISALHQSLRLIGHSLSALLGNGSVGHAPKIKGSLACLGWMLWGRIPPESIPDKRPQSTAQLTLITDNRTEI